MNFVSCVKWVKQGAANPEPDKVRLNSKELQTLLSENDVDREEEDRLNIDVEDEYGFKTYDEEDDTLNATLKNVAVYDEKFSKSSKKSKGSDSDSDEEDELIKPDDNLILVGHVDDDQSTLEIYVYNDSDGDMYIHHDIILSSAPLCVDPLYEKGEASNNLCVLGSMHPVIEVWDLDIIGCIEPAFKLGRHKKKNAHKNYGHTDAVLDVAWNRDLPHILSSASVDQTVLLWDLDNGSVSTTLSHFTEKVQSIAWNQFEPHNLLTGSSDKKVRNYDCRVYNTFQTWKLKSPVEKVTWSLNNSFLCFVGTEKGSVYAIDTRNDNKPVNQFVAHEKEVTGLVHSNFYLEALITCSADETFKIWNISTGTEQLIHSKNLKLDALQCLDINPDIPYLACIGGTSLRKNKNISVINMNNVVQKPVCKETASDMINNIALLDKPPPKKKKYANVRKKRN